MSRRRFVAGSVAIAVVLCVTGAWAYYKLAGAGESMLEEANKFLATFSGEQKAKVAIAQSPDWYYLVGEEQVGPVTLKELRQLARGKRIAPATQVWNPAYESWFAAGDIQGMFK